MNKEKEQKAIQYLKSFEPESEPYYLCYSGGKDSDCIRILAQLAAVKYEIWHNHTTVDVPETVRYVRSIPNIHISYPDFTMWQLVVKKKIPSTRLARYCCEELKERGGKGRMKITGVRWAESQNRKQNSDYIKIVGKPKTTQKQAEDFGVNFQVTKSGGMILNTDNDQSRRFVEHCYRTTSTMINPIVDWSDNDVWEFLRHYGCASNPLYQCGKNRIGCIGCPMQGGEGQKRDFSNYPKYRAIYVKTFDRMLLARHKDGLPNRETWANGESVMRWWIGDDVNQITFEEL